MTISKKSKIRKIINKNIFVLKNQIEALQEKVKPIAPDCSLGRLTRLEAMGEQHVNNKILDESKIRLIRLTNALLRIDKPVFGICIECEEDIALKRMFIRPESIRCVECENNI